MADFLDYQGKERNFLTGYPYSDAYKKAALIWANLPLYRPEKLKEFADDLLMAQVIFVKSGTGSGKTVIAPRLVLRNMYHMDPNCRGKVAVTVPKQLAAKEAAQTVAQFLDVQLGKEVDYGFRGKKASSMSQLRFVTDGLLLANIAQDPELSMYDAVLIDEAHERPVPTDVLLYFLREVVRRRPEFKLIIMSATIDETPYLKYFEKFRCRVFEISGGSNKSIEEHHAEVTPNPKKVVGIAAEMVAHLLQTTASGDIIVFVPTLRDTRTGCANVAKLLPGIESWLFCADMSASTDETAKELVMHASKYKDPDEPGGKSSYQRKVVFATNVAESSVTINGLKYVIETGLQMNVTYDPLIHGSNFEAGMITRGQATQRKGRVGRKEPGVVYYLYTEEDHKAMAEYPAAQILKKNLSDDILSMCSRMSVSETINVFTDLITSPSTTQIIDAIAYLHFYGLLDVGLRPRAPTNAATAFLRSYKPVSFSSLPYRKLAEDPGSLLLIDGTTTILGEVYNNAGKSESHPGLENAMLLLWGLVFGCEESMIVLASILQITEGKIESLWEHPPNAKVFPDTPPPLSNDQKRAVLHSSSDHLTLVNIYEKLFLQGDVANLSLGKWTQVHEYARQIADTAHVWLDELRRLDVTIPRLRAGATTPGLSPAENAILAARCFNACRVSSKNVGESVYPLKPSSAKVEFVFDGPVNPPEGGVMAVYETLSTSKAGASMKVITVFPTLPVKLLGFHDAKNGGRR